MSERETWYVMADGSYGDPREISAGADGVLRHKDGRAVAYAPHGPRSRGVDAAALRARPPAARDPLDHDADGKKGGSLPKPERDVTADADDKPPAIGDREMKPSGGGRTYRTRGKAD